MRLAIRFRTRRRSGRRTAPNAPGRLRQILDDAGDAVVAFDQQHVAGLDQSAQPLRIAWRERLIARHLLLEIARDQLADRVEHEAHDGLPHRGSSRPLVLCPSWWSKAIAIWFMGRPLRSSPGNHDCCRRHLNTASSRPVPVACKVSETMRMTILEIAAMPVDAPRFHGVIAGVGRSGPFRAIPGLSGAAAARC